MSFALSLDAPVAKIQFPVCVCFNSRYPRIPKRTHHKIDIGKSVSEIVRLLLKREDIILYPFDSSNPPNWVLPVTIFETAIVTPRTINKDPSVIIKEGSPLFTTVIPLQ
jgi:hypothetical protein